MRKFDDIIPPSRRKCMEQPVGLQKTANDGHRPFSHQSRTPYFIVGGAVAIIAVSVAALYFFSTSSVTVTPKSISVEVNDTFDAREHDTILPFEIIVNQKIATQQIKSTGTKTVNSAARGVITIYNTHSAPQRLREKTRFQSEAGLIFRIQSPVTVPAGSVRAPGSVQAKVTADQAGNTYNIGPSSFTVPGLIGTPQARHISARSTSAMKGGKSGVVPVVDPVLESRARAELIARLEKELADGLRIPENKVLIRGASAIEYDTSVITPSATEGVADIAVHGSIRAVIFNNGALARAIASSALGHAYQGEAITLVNTDNLLLTPRTSIQNDGEKAFSFTINGTAMLMYDVDTAKIAAAVSGKSQSDAQVILDSFPEIKLSSTILRPLWRQTFPKDPASIKVYIVHKTD